MPTRTRAPRYRQTFALLHEQNGVMGRANRMLAPRVTAIGTGTMSWTNPTGVPAGMTFTVGGKFSGTPAASARGGYRTISLSAADQQLPLPLDRMTALTRVPTARPASTIPMMSRRIMI